jgi:hypothetical protein
MWNFNKYPFILMVISQALNPDFVDFLEKTSSSSWRKVFKSKCSRALNAGNC